MRRSIGVLVVMLAVNVAFLDRSCAQPQARLINGEFDLCEIGGVACEWEFTGAGRAVNQDGRQGVSGLPSGESSLLAQRVPFAVPGGLYRVTLQSHPEQSGDMTIEVGCDPTGGALSGATRWATINTAGTAEVDCGALAKVIIVFVRFTNTGTAPVSAWVDGVFLECLHPGAAPIDGGAGSPIESDVATAQHAQLDEALALFESAHFERAAELIREMTTVFFSREVIPRALIGLQEAAHADDYLARRLPMEDQPAFLGLPFLRQVREFYPEQEEACALATCKMGEFYLSRQLVPVAKEFLQRTIADYDGTEAADWARAYMVNAHLWSGADLQAEQMVRELQDALARGEAPVEPVAWAEWFWETQRVVDDSEQGSTARLEAVRERFWTRYRDAFPEIALRAQTLNAETSFANGRIYEGVDRLNEITRAFPDNPTYTVAARIELAHYMFTHARSEDDRNAARAQLAVAMLTEGAPEYLLETAQRDLAEYDSLHRHLRSVTPPGDNIIGNPYFESDPLDLENSRDPAFWWTVPPGYDMPNWNQCDWEDGLPKPGLGRRTPAWNSVNYGTPLPIVMSSALESANTILPAAVPFTASIQVAADGWDGGLPSDVEFQLTLRFMDRYLRPLGEVSTGFVRCCASSQTWEELVLEGISPEECWLVVMTVSFRTDEPGHHAIAISHASVVYEEGE